MVTVKPCVLQYGGEYSVKALAELNKIDTSSVESTSTSIHALQEFEAALNTALDLFKQLPKKSPADETYRNLCKVEAAFTNAKDMLPSDFTVSGINLKELLTINQLVSYEYRNTSDFSTVVIINEALIRNIVSLRNNLANITNAINNKKFLISVKNAKTHLENNNAEEAKAALLTVIKDPNTQVFNININYFLLNTNKTPLDTEVTNFANNIDKLYILDGVTETDARAVFTALVWLNTNPPREPQEVTPFNYTPPPKNLHTSPAAAAAKARAAAAAAAKARKDSLTGGKGRNATSKTSDRPVSTGIKKNFIIDGKTATRTVHELQNGRHTKVVLYDKTWHLVSSLKAAK
jgi:hypothetical protein